MLLPRWLIKLGFHLLYYQMAWTYDVVAWSVSFGQWAAWRRLALPFFQPGPTLELAFGTGALFAEMTEGGYQPVGIDLSPYMARLAARRLYRRKLPLRLNRARVQALPFPTNHFANVVATFPTDYMLARDTMAEVHRVLRSAAGQNPAGRLVVVFEGQLRGPWPLRSLIDWLYEITAQRNLPPAKPLGLLNSSGFAARWEIVEREGAVARLLIAEKLN
ncbi:MAG: class I SAM-dependent methyltransferase [Chloroflexi bacterium]|nr:class I SAM-dependent methyltransferase [Chloroflexota bacterium]